MADKIEQARSFLEGLARYHVRDDDLLLEAINLRQGSEQRVALLGRALLEYVILDDWYSTGASKGRQGKFPLTLIPPTLRHPAKAQAHLHSDRRRSSQKHQRHRQSSIHSTSSWNRALHLPSWGPKRRAARPDQPVRYRQSPHSRRLPRLWQRHGPRPIPCGRTRPHGTPSSPLKQVTYRRPNPLHPSNPPRKKIVSHP